MTDVIPLFRVWMDHGVDEPLHAVLHSGYIGQGAKVDEFEARLAEYLGAPYVVTVNSGTSALHLAYRLAGVGPGSEVVTTPMTCMATNEPLLERGAKVVWSDIDPATGNISPDSVTSRLTPWTRAVVCVHWGGYPCDLDALCRVTDAAGVALIEDCAHAFGAEYNGAKIGAVGGRFRCFSFQAIKLLTSVDGGALVCRDEADYKRAKLLRWYGMDREDRSRLELRCEADVPEHGYKFHMNDVNAAIGTQNLLTVPARVKIARDNAAWYDAEIWTRDIRRVRPTARHAKHRSSYWLYTVLVDDPERFIPFMRERGIHASHVHVRNDMHSCFAGAAGGPLPGVDEFVDHQVSVPVGWWVDGAARMRVVDAMSEYEESK